MTHADIEELKRLTTELLYDKRETEVTLFTLMESLPFAVIMARNRKVVWANTAAANVFGWSREEMVDKPTFDFYATVEDYEKSGKILYGDESEGKSGIFVRLKRRSGDLFNGLIRAIHLSPDHDEVLVLILDLYDFTRRCTDMISLTKSGAVYAPPI
jgi:PAS domain S-box-containing protein